MGRRKNWASQSCLACPYASMAVQASAPEMTAQRAMPMMSSSSCCRERSERGSIKSAKCCCKDTGVVAMTPLQDF